ncbi:hypothetical protein, partial [Devosia alba]|uniref:hypothetical protein n=1 Tax=Devosia alba TaxID=3152360 RepID=UPI003263D41D
HEQLLTHRLSQAVLRSLNIIRDKQVRTLTLQLRSDTYARNASGLIQRLQIAVYIITLVRGTVTTSRVSLEVAQ